MNFGKTHNSQIKERFHQRQLDIEQSRLLLLELALYEPNITQCFTILINACITEDITMKVKGKNVTDSFKRFLTKHYKPFCADAIKCMFIYGFIPWFPRKLASGDVVPSILPHGTFVWGVKSIDKEAKRKRLAEYHIQSQNSSTRDMKIIKKQSYQKKLAHKNDDGYPKISSKWRSLEVPNFDNESKQVQYQIFLKHTDLDPQNVFVHDVVTPSLNITQQSMHYATVTSPLAHILVDYNNLRDAQIRRSYADAWNTTARIFTSCIPPPSAGDAPSRFNLFTSESMNNPGTVFNSDVFNLGVRSNTLQGQINQPSNHHPSLYTLPVHHRLEQLHALTPCEDLNFLLEKYKCDVTSLLGIPYELAYGKTSNLGNARYRETSESHSRVFSNTVQNISHVLEGLLCSVYSKVYSCAEEDIEVFFTPMPRLDIRNIEDLKILFDMGAVTPDITAQLSEVLLYGHKTNLIGRQRINTTHQPSEYMKNLKDITEATNPPKPPPKPASSGKKKTKSTKKSSSSKKT